MSGRYSASHLRERVTILSLDSTTDDLGEQTETKTEVATVWGGRLPQPGREAMRAEQVDAEQREMWVIRYRSDVTTLNEMRHDGRDLKIHSVVDVGGRREWLELICTVAR